MPRYLRIALCALVLMFATGCASRSDHDELRSDFESLKRDFLMQEYELSKWTQDLHAWEANTYVVICDLLAKNPASYAEEAALYCPGSETDEETEGQIVGTAPPAPPPFR